MNWLLLGHRSELATPGDYVRIPLPTGDIVAYNHGGEVVVTDGICPHRGARIFDGVAGSSDGVCRYHGWRFDGARDKPARWLGDWLFAKSSWDVTPYMTLNDQYGGFERFIEDTGTMIAGRHYGINEHLVNCRPAIAIENALEDMHIPHVHKTTFAPLKMRRIAQYPIDGNSMAVYELGDERTRKSIQRLGKYLEFDTGPRYFHLFLNPMTALSSVGGLTYSVQHYLPTADGKTLFLTRLYRGKTKPGAPDLTSFYDSAAAFNATVFREDAEMCERVVGPGGPLGPEEQRIRWFRDAEFATACVTAQTGPF